MLLISFQKACCGVRPDMLLIEKHTSDNVLPALHDLEHPRHGRYCRVHVVEVGLNLHRGSICSEKHTQKLSSIALCCKDLLKNAGYADGQLHLLIFGSTGGMLNFTALHPKRLQRVVVSHSTVDSLLQDMHWTVLRRLEQMTGMQPRLEHDSNQRIQGRPLANMCKHVTKLGWGFGVLDSVQGPTFSHYA